MISDRVRRVILLALAGVFLPLQLVFAQATAPNIVGTFTGLMTGEEFNCRASPGGPIVDPGPFFDSFTLTLNFTSQSGDTFTGSGSTADGDVIDPFTGTIQPDGFFEVSVTFSSVDGATGSAFVFGQLVGDTLQISSISGQDLTSVDSLLCEFQYSGTMTRITSSDPALAPPTDIATPAQLNSFVRFFSQSLSRRFNVFRSGVSGGASPVADGVMLQHGLSAGNGERLPIGVWGSWSHTNSKDDSFRRTFSSDRDQFLGGVDVSPREDLLVGVAVGYETTDASTPPDGGVQDIDGFTVAPYVAILLTDTISADFSVGFSSIDIDQSRVLAGTTLRSSVDSTRGFASGNLAMTKTYGSFTVTGLAGALYARESQDAFTEANAAGTLTVTNGARSFRIGQFRFGVEGAYAIGEFEPYVGATLEHDFTSTTVLGQSRDDTGGVLGGGVRYFGQNNGVTASVDYQSVVGRDSLNEGVFSVNLRMDF